MTKDIYMTDYGAIEVSEQWSRILSAINDAPEERFMGLKISIPSNIVEVAYMASDEYRDGLAKLKADD